VELWLISATSRCHSSSLRGGSGVAPEVGGSELFPAGVFLAASPDKAAQFHEGHDVGDLHYFAGFFLDQEDGGPFYTQFVEGLEDDFGGQGGQAQGWFVGHEAIDPSLPFSSGEVIAYAKSRLAAYKVPKTVEFVQEIPRSAATKINRRALVDARGG
jgi:acyl-CoA synthetase (AMP-forming)/AMP-acid ligase II